jgi:hypothetical protein
MTNLGTLALLAAIAAGQADAPAEHLKIFQPLIGQWIHVGPTQSDSPAFGPKGTEFGAIVTFTWAINKNALQIQWVGKAAHKDSVQFVELVGWDRKQKKLVSQGFSSTGNVDHNVWSCDGNTVICVTTGVTDEGKEVTMRWLHTFDGDTMTVATTDMVVDGKKQPDEETKYRRVR